MGISSAINKPMGVVGIVLGIVILFAVLVAVLPTLDDSIVELQTNNYTDANGGSKALPLVGLMALGGIGGLILVAGLIGYFYVSLGGISGKK